MSKPLNDFGYLKIRRKLRISEFTGFTPIFKIFSGYADKAGICRTQFPVKSDYTNRRNKQLVLLALLDSDVILAIKDLSEQDDRPFSQYINRVLRKYLISIGYFTEKGRAPKLDDN